MKPKRLIVFLPCSTRWFCPLRRSRFSWAGLQILSQTPSRFRRAGRSSPIRCFTVGESFVSNAVPDNTVGELFSRVPNGTVLLKFDNSTHRFASRNMFRRGRWTRPNQPLAPGEGAYLFNPTRQPWFVTFTGDWQYGAVSLPTGLSLISSPGPGTIDFAPPPVNDGSVPPGPFASSGIRFDPQEGDAVYTFASRRGTLVCHRFQNGAWDTLPVLEIGESCFVLTSHPRLIQYTGPLPLAPN